MVSTITNHVTATVTIGNGTYTSPLTITAGGTVSASGIAIYAGPSYANATLVNAGHVSGSGDGILLSAGGLVSNTGTVLGGGFVGVELLGGASTVVNGGLISGGAYGILLSAGGLVSNTGSVLGGNLVGVELLGGAGTVINGGVISGSHFAVTNFPLIGSIDPITHSAIVVPPGSPVSVVNLFGGIIEGEGGLVLAGAGATVDNDGVIVATAPAFANQYAGIVFEDPGSVLSNTAHGRVTGFYGVQFEAAGIVINLGVIADYGTSGAGVVFSSGGYIANSAGGVISGGVGIELLSGGTVVNAGAINGASAGIVLSGTGTLRNSGTIKGGSAGVVLAAGGTLVASGGVVLGAVGIQVSGTAATVANNGTVIGTTGAGINLAAGGVVSNTAMIRGASGVQGSGVAATVSNAGTIIGTSGAGVTLAAGGLVSNGTSAGSTALIQGAVGVMGSGASAIVSNFGTITGTSGVGIGLVAGGTVVDAGKIAGSNGTAVSFGGTGNNRLVLDAGYVLSGVVVAAGTANALEFGSSVSTGTITGLTSNFNGFATLTVDAGANWVLTGNQTLVAGVTLTDLGSLTNSGNLTIAGALVVDPTTLINSGTISGTVTLAGGGELLNSGSVLASGNAVYGVGGAATIVNSGSIVGSGNGIDLVAGGTVIDAGTITGGSGTAIAFGGSGSNRLVLDPGFVISGNVVAAGTANVLELGSAVSLGTLNGTAVGGFASVVVDAGAHWKLAGGMPSGAGATLAGHAYFNNSGTIIAVGTAVTGTTGGNTVVNTGTITGSSALYLAGGSNLLVLDPGGAITGGITATGGNNSLELRSGAAAGTISGLGVGGVAGFRTLTVNAGASWTLSGSISLSGITLSDLGTLTIAGAAAGAAGVNGSYDPINQIGGAGGTGGTGFTASGGGLLRNTGTVLGGQGGDGHGAYNAAGAGGAGGAGLVFMGSLINLGSISGGNGGAAGLITGDGLPPDGGAGGTGVVLTGNLFNAGLIAGGAGRSGGNGYAYGANGGAGGAGVVLSSNRTVTNTGTILGATGGAAGTRANTSYGHGGSPGAAGAGITLAAGGVVDNGTAPGGSALIWGAGAGVLAGSGAAAIVTNYGTIIGLSGAGVALAGGGTVLDGGTITGGNGTAVYLGGGGQNRLVLAPGGVLSGMAVAAGNANVLGLASASATGTVMGIGNSVTGFGTIAVYNGARWTLAGQNTLGGGVTVSNLGTLLNTGTLSVSGANTFYDAGRLLMNTGAIVANGFALNLVNGSTLFNAGTITGGAGTAIYFGGGNNLLMLSPGEVIAGRIVAAGAGNTIELGSAASVGTLLGLGSGITGFGTLTVDAGAQWSVAGNATLALNDSGTIAQTGTLILTAGSIAAGGVLSGVGLLGGTLNGTGAVIASGGTLELAATVANSLTLGIAAGADLRIDGTLSTGLLVGANQTLEAGPSASLTLSNAETLTGGATIVVGGTVTDAGGIVVGNGGRLFGLPGGYANVPGITVLLGGLASGVTINDGNSLTVSSGGAASATTLTGNLAVLAHGTATGTMVQLFGVERVAGKEVGGTISAGGVQFVQSGGVVSTTTISASGIEEVLGGGTAVSTTIAAGGTENVFSGGTTTGTFLNSDATLFVMAGGTAIGTVLDGAAKEFVSGIDIQATISSGDLQVVESGGLAKATTILAGGTQTVSSGGTTSDAMISGGSLDVMSGGRVTGSLEFIGTGGSLELDGTLPASPTALFGGTAISGFLTGNTIDLTALAYNSVHDAAIVNHQLQLTEDGNTYLINLDPAQDYAGLFAHAASDGLSPTAGTDLFIDGTACYCRGTMILTTRGEVPVEQLAIGDLVVTLSGAERPIHWIGRRGYDGRFVAGNRDVLPICVKPDAIMKGVPARELWLSPEHSLYIGDVLVQAKHLVNGITVVQTDRVDAIEYLHIELESHDVIYADGTPAETYVDCDNRLMFANGREYERLGPDDERPRWRFCAPRLEWGSPELATIRECMFDRARQLGHVANHDPGLHLVVDGVVQSPTLVAGKVYRFALAPGCGAVWLRSQSVVPAEWDAASRDIRRLGVPLERLVLSDADVSIEAWHGHSAFRDGFHDDENTQRWTDGRARIPAALLRAFPAAVILDVHLAGDLRHMLQIARSA